MLADKWIFLTITDIVYGETCIDDTKLFMNDGNIFNISGNLTETAKLIDEVDFFRISSRNLVNLAYFIELDNSEGKRLMHLDFDFVLTVSFNKYDLLIKHLLKMNQLNGGRQKNPFGLA